MPTADGFIKSLNEREFSAVFLVSHVHSFNFLGKFTAHAPQFSSTEAARVTYNDLSELTETKKFEGVINRSMITLVMENGVRLEARLDEPVEEGRSVKGDGVWRQQ
ncbi:hypothetical protein B0H34DRAFT_256607 [Crassisporium funariophilum]|nr:hypothetical protein B0H34DRAFT_256607 [Crassisporium funariophilum]